MPNIPVSVYTRLVDGVNRHLPTFHRYLKLRKRMMGVTDDLHYYDLYAPLVASVNLRYTPEEAQQHVIAAMAPLGSDYTGVLQRAFKEHLVTHLPHRVLPIGSEPPRDIQVLLDDEFTHVASLLGPEPFCTKLRLAVRKPRTG